MSVLVWRRMTAAAWLRACWPARRKLSTPLVAVISFFAGVFVTLAPLHWNISDGSIISSRGGLLLHHTAQSESADSPIRLAIIVLTAAANSERRAAMRATWLQHSAGGSSSSSSAAAGGGGSSHRHWFVIGTAGVPSATLRQLQTEHGSYGDLLLLPTVDDHYQQLTGKLLAALVWLSTGSGAADGTAVHSYSHVLKCDDDTFVRVGQLLQLLRRWPRQRLYAGFFDGRARPFSGGQWQQRDWHLCDRYLPYALGGGYVVSADLVRYVAANSGVLRRFVSEDVAMGVWLAPVDALQRRHSPLFDTEYRSRGCDNRYVVTHKQTPAAMLAKQRSLQTSGAICERQWRARLSYVYDWSVPPSQCCRRINDSSVP